MAWSAGKMKQIPWSSPSARSCRNRRKGCNFAWEQCKLGDVFAERSEKSQDGNEELLSVTLKDGVIKSKSLDRKNTASHDKRNYKLVIPNDIAYNSMRMWQGALGVSKFSGIVSPAYTVIKLRNQLENPYFYQYYFKKNEMLNVFRKNSQGLTSDTWNLKYPLFSRIRFFTASTREQQQISSLLYLLDQTITLHEEKKRQLERLKNALLQKMFAYKSGYPAIRFEGFSDEWKIFKLSSFATMHARIGWQNLRTSEFLSHGKYMLITGTDFNNGQIDFSTCHYVEKERYEQDKYIQIKNGSILITKDGTLGKVAYVHGLSKPATLNAGIFNIEIRNENEIDRTYLFQYLKAPYLMNYVQERATGGTIKHLNQSILKSFPVQMPNKIEQNKIGELITKLDHLINLQRKKLNNIAALKNSLLQSMFI